MAAKPQIVCHPEVVTLNPLLQVFGYVVGGHVRQQILQWCPELALHLDTGC